MQNEEGHKENIRHETVKASTLPEIQQRILGFVVCAAYNLHAL